MSRLRTILMLVLALYACAGVSETRISDPMRPPDAKQVKAGSSAAKKQGWWVTEVLISPERRIAVVNGRVVKVGSTINGAKVSAIYGNAVKLDVNGKTVFISPIPRDIKRRSRQ